MMIHMPRFCVSFLAALMMTCVMPESRLEAQSSGEDGHADETHNKIERLKARIDELRENIDDSPAQDSLSYRWSRNLDQLKIELSEQMERLRVAGSDTWSDLVGSVEGAVQGLESGYHSIRQDYYLRQARQQLEDLSDMVKEMERADTSEDAGNPVAGNLITFRNKVYEAEEKIEMLSKASPAEWPAAKHDVNYLLEEVELTGRYLVQKYALWRIQERVGEYEQLLDDTKSRAHDEDDKMARERLQEAAENLKDLLNDMSVEDPEEWKELKVRMEHHVSEAEQAYAYLSREPEP